MTDPTFRAKIRPELHPAAQELVKVYNDTYGSCSPGCCPKALSAVLMVMANRISRDLHPVEHVAGVARLLRGEQP